SAEPSQPVPLPGPAAASPDTPPSQLPLASQCAPLSQFPPALPLAAEFQPSPASRSEPIALDALPPQMSLDALLSWVWAAALVPQASLAALPLWVWPTALVPQASLAAL